MNSFGFGGVNGHVILEPYTHINKEEFVQGIQLRTVTHLYVSRYTAIHSCNYASQKHLNAETKSGLHIRELNQKFILLFQPKHKFTLKTETVLLSTQYTCLN